MRAVACGEVARALDEVDDAGATRWLGRAVEHASGIVAEPLDELRAEWLVRLFDWDPARARIETDRLLETGGPSLLRATAANLPALRGSDSEDVRQEALALLRRAAKRRDDPLCATSLYNRAALLSAPEELDEARRTLSEVRADRLYRDAWYVERFSAALEWGKFVSLRRDGQTQAAGAAAKAAARHYSRALRLRRRSERLEHPSIAMALRGAPRSPVLHANAYDAHHFAGHRWRAWWHHRRAQSGVRRLYTLGVRAMGRGDWRLAARAFELASTSDWADEIGIRARVFGAAALRQLGDAETAERVWQEALAMDDHTARRLRSELRERRDATGLSAGMPGDRTIESDSRN